MSTIMEKDCKIARKEILRYDFTKWENAVFSHANGDYMDALEAYASMNEISSRIFYNMAIAYMKLGDYENALSCFTSAVGKDENLAIALFQRGSLQLEHENAREAIADLEKCRLLLRGNLHINYRPLGLLCHLNEFTILYNLSLSYLLNGEVEAFRMMLTEATHNADRFQRNQISDTLKLFQESRMSEIQPIQLNTDAVFVPPKEIVSNLEHRKSSKRSMVVFASDEKDNTPSYKCAERVDELCRSLKDKRNTEIKKGSSIKDRIVQKIKSTGDLNISSNVRKNLSARKQRHSTGGEGYVSDIPYVTLKEIKQSKMTSRLNNDAIFSSDEQSSTDRKPVLGNIEICTQEDKFQALKELNNDHFDAETENILVSTHLMNDNFTEKADSDKVFTGSRRRFKGKAKSIGDLKVKVTKNKKIERAIKSTGNLDRTKTKQSFLLDRKKKSRTSFKMLIKSRYVTIDQIQNNSTVLMKGCKDEEDMLSLMVPFDSSLDEKGKASFRVPALKERDANNNANNSFKQGSRYSLGAIFGNRASAVQYALTEACDILTAAVTPTIDPFKLKSSDTEGKKNNLSQKENSLAGQRKMQQSSKKKRAPDPPTSNVCTLLAAGHIFTTLVRHDYNRETPDPMTLLENATNLTTDNHNDASEIRSSENRTRKQPENNIEITTPPLEESCTSISLSNTAFVFPPVSKMDVSPDMNNNEKNSGIEEALIKEPVTPEYVNTKQLVEIIVRSSEKDGNKKTIQELTKREELYKAEPEHENVQDEKNAVKTRMRNLFKAKGAKQPPPSYPPPPLRPSSTRDRNAKQRKENKLSLNGLVGNTLLKSGQLIRAIVPMHENDGTCNLLIANVNKNTDDHSCNGKVNELNTYMETALQIKEENSDEHVYVNVNKNIECPVNMRADNIGAAVKFVDQSKQQQPEDGDETFPVSPNILQAFITSNEKIRQTFGEFIHEQRNSKSAENGRMLLKDGYIDDSEHNYVNINELQTENC